MSTPLCSQILDFGLARQADSEMTGYVVTRWYRAPEVILNWMHYTQTGKPRTYCNICLKYKDSDANRKLWGKFHHCFIAHVALVTSLVTCTTKKSAGQLRGSVDKRKKNAWTVVERGCKDFKKERLLVDKNIYVFVCV